MHAGIIGTGKTILYEVSDNTNQGVGMSSIAMAWGSGIIAGPLISGQYEAHAWIGDGVMNVNVL